MGTLTNSKKFDSTYDQGKPFEFELDKERVIKALDWAVAKMSIG